MKKESEVNENLDILFEKLEEKDEFATLYLDTKTHELKRAPRGC